MKVYMLIWDDGIIAGIYKDPHVAEAILLEDYVKFLITNEIPQKEIVKGLQDFCSSGRILGIGRVIEKTIIE